MNEPIKEVDLEQPSLKKIAEILDACQAIIDLEEDRMELCSELCQQANNAGVFAYPEKDQNYQALCDGIQKKEDWLESIGFKFACTDYGADYDLDAEGLKLVLTILFKNKSDNRVK